MKIAEVFIEKDEHGKITYWFKNAGLHASQGGMEFGIGNFGVENLDIGLDRLKIVLSRDMDLIMDNFDKSSDKPKK